MQRPALVLIDHQEERRAALGRGLTAAGHEVVPVAGAADGLRFARGLEGAVIVAPADFITEENGALDRAAAAGRTVVLLGALPDGVEVGDEILTLRPPQLTAEALLGPLHLVLVGRELGIEVDTRGETLLGDLALHPLLELVQGLAKARVSGRLELERGRLTLDRGTLVEVVAGAARGKKAFCRLARLSAGPFRILVEPPAEGEPPQVDEDVQEWIVAAIEDSLGEYPDPRLSVEIEIGPDFFSQKLSPLAQEIVRAAQKGVTLAHLLDQLEATDGAIVQELLRLAERGIAVLHEPAPAVRVITDSTADLPSHIARENGIEVVPLGVHFGKRSFRDGVDLSAGRFYRLLEKSSAHPSTEPPPTAVFARRYGAALERSDVVSLHLSRQLSETFKHARQAAPGAVGAVERAAPRLEVVDSRSVSMGLGMLALFAARMAARGEPAAKIAARLEAMVGRLHLLFVVDTLDYLARGGRIGKAQAFVGKLLGIKPILGVDDGEVVPFDRARGGRAAQGRLLDLLESRLEPGRPIIAGIGHANAPMWADRLKRLLEERFRIAESMLAEIGPVVGTHVGPGTVGVVVFQPTDEEAEWIAPLSGQG